MRIASLSWIRLDVHHQPLINITRAASYVVSNQLAGVDVDTQSFIDAAAYLIDMLRNLDPEPRPGERVDY